MIPCQNHEIHLVWMKAYKVFLRNSKMSYINGMSKCNVKALEYKTKKKKVFLSNIKNRK